MTNAALIKESNKEKAFYSDNYNYYLNKETGFFARWGKNKEDDPNFSPFGPEILDLEISTSVSIDKIKNYEEGRLVSTGGCLGNCAFCYKSNSKSLPVYNMSFSEFKDTFSKVNKNKQLISIAFGIMNIDTNPDFFEMARHAKENGVMPTFTCHGLDNLTEKKAYEIASLFGACAVSVYDKEKSYNTIKKLTDAGMKQVNIHFMISNETVAKANEILEDIKNDERLKGLNAIVFLSLKKKGKAKENNYNIVNLKDYKDLIEKCLSQNISFGFDSCAGNKIASIVKVLDIPQEQKDRIFNSIEPCESFGMFSSYINAEQVYFPCSFCENENGWEDGFDLKPMTDFIKDVWFNEKTVRYRKASQLNERKCIIFDV